MRMTSGFRLDPQRSTRGIPRLSRWTWRISMATESLRSPSLSTWAATRALWMIRIRRIARSSLQDRAQPPLWTWVPTSSCLLRRKGGYGKTTGSEGSILARVRVAFVRRGSLAPAKSPGFRVPAYS